MTTWDPATATNMIFSNGNLTALGDGTPLDIAVRATTFVTSGRYYWEVNVDTCPASSSVIGIGSGSWAFGLTFPGNDAASIGCSSNSGVVWYNGSVITTIQSCAPTNTCCIALDIGNTNIWWRTNNGNWNNSGTANPATNTGGISISAITGNLYPAISVNTNGQDTGRFLAASWGYTAPSGFLSLDPVATITPPIVMKRPKRRYMWR